MKKLLPILAACLMFSTTSIAQKLDVSLQLNKGLRPILTDWYEYETRLSKDMGIGLRVNNRIYKFIYFQNTLSFNSFENQFIGGCATLSFEEVERILNPENIHYLELESKVKFQMFEQRKLNINSSIGIANILFLNGEESHYQSVVYGLSENIALGMRYNFKGNLFIEAETNAKFYIHYYGLSIWNITSGVGLGFKF